MNRNTRIARRLASEQGEGIVSALILLPGVLIPLIYLVALFGRIEQGRLAARQAAQAAVRAATQAPTAAAAQTEAEQQLADEQAQTQTPLGLRLEGGFGRGALLEADVSGQVALGYLPLLGSFGTITVNAVARAPVDQYRSLAGVVPLMDSSTRLANEQGSIAISGLLLSLALALLISTGVDIAHAFILRRDLAGVADDAALTGSQQLDLVAWRQGILALDPQQAEQAAETELAADPQVAGTVHAQPSSVIVVARQRFQTIALRLVGIAELTVTASATATPEKP